MTQLAKWSGETWSYQWDSSRTLVKLSGSVDVSKLDKYVSTLRVRDDYQELKHHMITGTVSEGWKDLNVSDLFFRKRSGR